MGEMERDALIAHGASAVITDRFLNCSDLFQTHICETCGFIAESASKKQTVLDILHLKPFCRFCQSNQHILQVDVPYAFKLLVQELQALHIGLKLQVKPTTSYTAAD